MVGSCRAAMIWWNAYLSCTVEKPVLCGVQLSLIHVQEDLIWVSCLIRLLVTDSSSAVLRFQESLRLTIRFAEPASHDSYVRRNEITPARDRHKHFFATALSGD